MSSDRMLNELIPFGLLFVFVALPVLWVIVSGRSHGGAKFGWFIVALLFSWLGLAVFLIATQSKKDQRL